MKIPGYSHWLSVFRPLNWLVPLAEQMYDAAGVLLAADTPLPDETVRLLQRIAGELGEIRDILGQPSLPVECGAPLKGHPKCCTRPLGHSDKHWNPYFGNWSADETSAPPVAHSRSPEDAAGGPPPIAPDTVSGGGHPNVEIRECICGRRFEVITADAKPWTVCPHCMKTEIPDEYWGGALK